MNDLMTPDWIKQRQSQNALRDARREADAQRALADSFKIQKDSPRFCKDLLKELAINTNALPKLDLRGDVAELPSLSGEVSCRVSVVLPGNFVKQTYTDVFTRTLEIECSMLNGGIRRYYFCVADGVVGVLPEYGGSTVLRAEDVAREIVERMVDHLSSPSFLG